jgi:nucleoside-diphosphate-sugar epimerase
MVLENKKILVTGADGFIGSHLVEHLADKGYDVRAFVLYNSLGSRGWLDSASLDNKSFLRLKTLIPRIELNIWLMRFRECLAGC